MTQYLGGVVAGAFQAYFIILLARVILSWMSLTSQRSNPVVVRVGRIVYALTEPLLRPIRTALRPYQGRPAVDFSPMVLYLVLGVLEQVLLTVLRNARM